MPVKRVALAILALALSAAPARAQDLKDRFNIRISLSGMYLRESQSEDDPIKRIAGPLSLGYGDLRTVLDVRRLPGNFELHLDGRIRLTGNFDTGAAITQASNGQVGARGYLGGREYQITELWARGRWSKLDLGLGRMIVPEADAMRIDGARFWVHAHKHWDVSVYAGAYPDQFSRSLTTDYVAGDTIGAGLAFAGGVSARYGYDKVWGSFSANAAYLGGNDEGGPLVIGTNASGNASAAASNPQTEKVRSYVTWTNFFRPIKYLDLYHDLVVDVAGAAGAQLTRIDAYIAIHMTKSFTLRLGYDHMSSIAIEMYLARLLANRVDFQPASIENNLTLSRTARDEARGTFEAQVNRTVFTVEGRFRRRVLVTPSNDPQFVFPAGDGNIGTQVAPRWGWDATVSVRNRGSVWGLRPSLWATYLDDYRAKNIYVGVGVGRDFLGDRLNVDLGLTYANTRDEQVDNPPDCSNTLPFLSPVPQLTALQGCFGTRKGHNVQAGLTIAGMPAKHWFAFLDYRAGVALSEAIPAVITHVLLARIEARY